MFAAAPDAVSLSEHKGPRLDAVDEAMVEALLSRMSLKEKVGQMFQVI